jgi:hypothetical protein
LLVGVLIGSSLVVLVSIGLAARLAGFRGLDLVNLAVTCNARGGPGIVLASVALTPASSTPASSPPWS